MKRKKSKKRNRRRKIKKGKKRTLLKKRFGKNLGVKCLPPFFYFSGPFLKFWGKNTSIWRGRCQIYIYICIKNVFAMLFWTNGTSNMETLVRKRSSNWPSIWPINFTGVSSYLAWRMKNKGLPSALNHFAVVQDSTQQIGPKCSKSQIANR